MDVTRPGRPPDHARPAQRLAANLEPHEHGRARPGAGGLLRRGLGNDYLQTIATAERGGGDRHSLNVPIAPDGARQGVKGMSASGDPSVAFKYSPEAGDKSTKIVFIQVMRELLDGTPAKPSESDATFAFQDADTTTDFYHVDYESGEADPYYNGDDRPQDFGTQGSVGPPKVDSESEDEPDYDDADFPAGKSKITYEFRTIAFSAAGPDKGTYYAYAHWTYQKEKGNAATITHQGTSTDTSLPKSKAAITLWASNHGFVMPA